MQALKVTASPAAGPPGTTVTITGTLPVALSPRPDGVSLCWDGCPGGLSYPAETLHWLSSTTFQTTMVVPQAPWVNASPPRVVPLASGTYTIGVQCLQEAPSCGLGGAEATTSFQLDVPAADAPSWCHTADSCAQMTVSPAHALPGEDVTVTGFAPVASIGGDGQPYAYQLQEIPAPISGPPVQFQSLAQPGPTLVYFGFGALTVTASPTLASINTAGWRVQGQRRLATHHRQPGDALDDRVVHQRRNHHRSGRPYQHDPNEECATRAYGDGIPTATRRKPDKR